MLLHNDQGVVFFSFAEDGKQMLIDIDSRSKDEIEEHLIKVIGKTR